MKPIIACRPVKLDPSHWLDRELEQLPIYDDAIQMTCEICEELCYVGPRQRQTMHEIDCEVLCSRCVLTLQSLMPQPLEIRDLGNPGR